MANIQKKRQIVAGEENFEHRIEDFKWCANLFFFFWFAYLFQKNIIFVQNYTGFIEISAGF